MRDSLGDKSFFIINYSLLAIFALSCVIPLFHIASVSLSGEHAVISGHVFLWPVGLNFESYLALFNETNILQALGNSVVITGAGVFLSMLFTMLGAYPLSKKYFAGRKYVMMAIIFTMAFNGGIIPTFLLVKSLGLVDSFGAIWLVSLISPFNLLIMKTFFENVPEELEEASRIDGCGELRLLFNIYLPLSLPVIATLSLFYGINYWNKFGDVLVFINDVGKQNLVVLVNKLVQSTSMLDELNQGAVERDQVIIPDMIKSASVMVLILPILAVYPFVQRYFVKGIMIGAVKG